MKKLILLSAAAVLLGSCGVYTKYKPATEVPQNLYGEEAAALTAEGQAPTDSTESGLGALDWKQFFTDPYLQALIEQGLEHNTDYLSAQLRVEEAKATLLSAKLAFLPSFALAPQGTVSSFDGMKASQTYSCRLQPVGNWTSLAACAMLSSRPRRFMHRATTIVRPCAPSSLPALPTRIIRC